MAHLFTQEHPSIESFWRSVILFGRNVASYKFALAKSLLELVEGDNPFVSLEELAEPYSKHLIEHLSHSPKQITSQASDFLDTCTRFNQGEVTKDKLIGTTVSKGFNNVLDAFHVVNREIIPIKFFEVSKQGNQKGLVLTDEVFKLQEIECAENLAFEIEGRWNLVEKSWELDISRNLLDVKYDDETKLFYFQRNQFQRVDVTSSRNALDGYQKGKCFYCFDGISIDPSDEKLADVDHFFPYILESNLNKDLNINGVWNLVLACNSCNRGENGKFARVPCLTYLERLHKRNEFLIDSHHPLRETLMMQTGINEIQRRNYLQERFKVARNHLIFEWETELKGEVLF
ncbi:MAG: HNH endonuclease [Syntrophomonadaceae bacterium]